MRHERLMGIVSAALRGAPLLVLGLLGAAALAYTVHWHQTNTRRHGRAPFDLIARPGNARIPAGATARYRIVVRRGRYRGPVKLALVSRHKPGRADYAAASKRPGRIHLSVRGRRRAVLTVETSARDRPGQYAVTLQATGGHYRGYLTLALTVKAAQPASVHITGHFGELWPGTSQPVDLVLTNPNAQAIRIRALTVAVTGVSAPRATRSLPCSKADFSVTQFSGAYPLRMTANASTRLSALGITPARQPHIAMLDRPVNQDGCQGATVTVTYNGTATSS